MAEIVGVVSAGFGLAGFIVQITESIGRLREARVFIRQKAPGEVELLIGRLEYLRQILLSLDDFEGHRIVDLAIDHCQLVYSSVDHTLQTIFERLSNIEDNKWKVTRKSVDLKDTIRTAGNKLDFIINELNCALTRDLHHIVSKNIPASREWPESTVHAPPLLSTHQLGTNEPANTSLVPSVRPGAQTCLSTTSITAFNGRAPNCGGKHCHCRCHLTRNISKNIWGLEYTPLSTILKTCDNAQCSGRRYRWNVRLVLTRYGVPLSVMAGLEILTGMGKYTLRPAMTLQSIVKHTSPGFLTLSLFSRDIIPLAEAKKRLVTLFREDTSMRYHTNPDGYSYVQEFLSSNFRDSHDESLQMLNFLVCELGMSLDSYGQDLLIQCARWTARNLHLDVLDILLKNGYPVDAVDSPIFKNWPKVSARRFTPQIPDDPFFIEFIGKIDRVEPTFGGLTPLHGAVLRQSLADVTALLMKTAASPSNSNFLGQMPIHFAVPSPEIVKALLEAEHDIDVADRQGRTPLMYAAAVGNSATAQLLIEKGASITAQDNYGLGFICHASGRGNWGLIMDSIRTIQAQYEATIFQDIVRHTIVRLLLVDPYMPGWPGHRRLELFTELIDSCEDVDLLFEDDLNGTTDNTILHYVRDCYEANALFNRGFTSFSRPNSHGQLPIHTISGPSFPQVLDLLNNHHGIEINAPDQYGRTVVFLLASDLLANGAGDPTRINCIKACLELENINVLSSDGCKCPCAPEGCSIAALFKFHVDGEYSLCTLIRTLWLLTLTEYHGCEEASKGLLLALLRRALFDRLDMTHVCCHRGTGISSPRDTSRLEKGPIAEPHVGEILEEESEFITILETDMQRMNSKPMESIWSRLLEIVKVLSDEGYMEAETDTEENEGEKREVEGWVQRAFVNYDRDTMQFVEWRWEPAAPRQEARQYSAWLDQEYANKKRSADAGGQADERYARWQSLLRELVQAFDLEV
ncbi:hypothetical protein BJY01DRAFT_256150 [Aspergillus pseudoustus]|uniref:Ankyrin repeat-containing domain protein n=1 Tax=Aspergillus pseudoustus TaxID=1810923 RepID=A0ABR4IDP8_9EURO